MKLRRPKGMAPKLRSSSTQIMEIELNGIRPHIEGAAAIEANLTIRSFTVRAVNAPLRQPHHTAGGVITSAPLVLLDLETNEGVVGRAYAFCYAAFVLSPVAQLTESLGEMLQGSPAFPATIEATLQARFRLLGPQGLTGIAMALIDMAAWDAVGQAAGLPLASLLGAVRRPVPAYCSLGMAGTLGAARDAEASVTLGFDTLKLKVGYATVAEDISAVRAARAAVNRPIKVLVDFNQTLSVPEAIARCKAMEAENLVWIEEPVSHRDAIGHAKVAAESSTPIQVGENWWGVPDMMQFVRVQASDYIMLDVMKIGGVTGWMRAAALAEAHGLLVSSHLFPEVSAHLLAATPTMHLLEWQDWAEPILAEPTRPERGYVHPSERPGIGLVWDNTAVARYAA